MYKKTKEGLDKYIQLRKGMGKERTGMRQSQHDLADLSGGRGKPRIGLAASVLQAQISN